MISVTAMMFMFPLVGMKTHRPRWNPSRRMVSWFRWMVKVIYCHMMKFQQETCRSPLLKARRIFVRVNYSMKRLSLNANRNRPISNLLMTCRPNCGAITNHRKNFKHSCGVISNRTAMNGRIWIIMKIMESLKMLRRTNQISRQQYKHMIAELKYGKIGPDGMIPIPKSLWPICEMLNLIQMPSPSQLNH